MNLYLRFLRLVLAIPFVRTQPLDAPSMWRLRAWPWDCDINLHLTNSRYLAFMDLGRTHLIIQSGMLGALLRRGWLPVAGAVALTFVRAIPPMAKVELQTRLVGWDDKYWYIEQQFIHRGAVCATALVRGVFVQRGQVVPVAEVVALAGLSPVSPPLPEAVAAWKDLLAAKRRAAR